MGKLVVGSVVLAGLLAALITLYYFSKKEAVRVDQVTLCPLDKPLPAVVPILIDVSDPLSEAGRLDILNRLEDVQRSLPRFALLDLYVLSQDDTGLVKPVLSLCNPGDGSAMNQLYQNPQLAKKHWEKDFKVRVDAVLKVAVSSSPGSFSPIFEAIQSVAIQSFGRPGRANAARQLIVVSDLIQNVPGKYSQYKTPLDFEEFSRGPYYTSIRADLQNVSVVVLYLTRVKNNSVQAGRRHIDFWNAFFDAQGASVERVHKIFGAQ